MDTILVKIFYLQVSLSQDALALNTIQLSQKRPLHILKFAVLKMVIFFEKSAQLMLTQLEVNHLHSTKDG